MTAWAHRRARAAREAVAGGMPSRRHGRRPIRSSMTGPALPDPDTRALRFELAARGAIEVLRYHLGHELDDVHIAFSTAPMPSASAGDDLSALYYSIDRPSRSILLHRMPIQRANVLHVDDAEHRRLFIEHCVYQAICAYLGRDPWEVLPGRFDHY